MEEYDQIIENIYLTAVNDKKTYHDCVEYLTFLEDTNGVLSHFQVCKVISGICSSYKLQNHQIRQIWNKIAFHLNEDTTKFFKYTKKINKPSKSQPNSLELLFENGKEVKRMTLNEIRVLIKDILQEKETMTVSASAENQVMRSTSLQNKDAFKQVSYVYGVDVETMSAKELLVAIKRVKAEIADLKAANVESTYVSSEIVKLEEALSKIVAKLDTFA